MRGKWLLAVGVLVILGIGAGTLSRRLRRAPAAPGPKAAEIVQRKEIAIPGTVRAQHVTGVGAEIDGNIEAFAVDVGDEVFEGQLLARIGSAGLETQRQEAATAAENAQQQVGTAEAAVASARLEASRADADMQRSRANTERAKATFDRQTLLHSKGATPRLKYEAAVQDYETAVKEFEVMDKAQRAARDALRAANDQLARAKQDLAEKGDQVEAAEGAFAAAELRSPVAGTVVARNGEVGKPAREFGNNLFQIATDLFALEVAADPNPEQMKQIHPGQDVMVVLPDLGGVSTSGRVREIKDPQAIVEFNGTSPAIKPGMRAEVRIRLD